ncbi:MAG: hypothetical protein EPN93_19820 [Spirochaetes bacterium]|nr:MAG: hypothetical protein EPN93_19820 [Spirochaetota bacterium]
MTLISRLRSFKPEVYLRNPLVLPAGLVVFMLVPLVGWDRLPEFDGPRLLAAGVMFAAGAWWCARGLYRGSRIYLRPALLDVLVLLFYSLYLVSWIVSSNRAVSSTAVLLEAAFPALYVFCRVVMRDGEGDAREPIVALSGAVTAAALVLAGWGLLQYFFEFDVPRGVRELFKTYHYPVVASMDNPNYLSEFLVLALPFSVSFFTALRRYRLMLVSLVIMGLAVYFTYSRLAWFVLACAMLLMIPFSPKRARAWLLGSLGAIVLITGAFFAFHFMSGSTQSDRVLNSFTLSRTTPLFERRVLYATGFSMLGDAGVAGKGPGMFGYRYLEYQGRYINSVPLDRFQLSHLVDIDHAHSDLIEIAFDSGMPAAAAFLSMLGAAIYAGVARARRRDHASFIALVPLIYLPFCLWSFPFYIPFSKILFIAALALVASSARPVLGVCVPSRVPAAALAAVLAAWGWWGYRYAASDYWSARAAAASEAGGMAAGDLYSRALGYYPWNGRAYLGRGVLLAARGDPRGVRDLADSMEYISDPGSYLALARSLREQGRTAEARKWYKKLIYLRPDIRKAVQEYRELGPGPGDAGGGKPDENND